MSIDNLHDPSAAPPAAAFASSPAPTVQFEALRLTTLKDSITERLDVYFSVLQTNKVTMSTPLVDPEGFPRSDIDVAGVRTARMQINRLKNDLKAVVGEMAALLEKGIPRVEAEEQGTMLVEAGRVEEGKQAAFARVDGVFPGGPADMAGLRREDTVVSLGSVDATNHDSLKGVAALVGSSEGTALPLVILRPSQTEGSEPQLLHLRLTPKSGWGGRGLLGCHIVPI